MKTKSRDNIITNDTVRAAYETLEKYKAGKASLDSRIIENEQWWRLRHYSGSGKNTVPSAWLFNSVANKHADAMDNIPSAACLPREECDAESARLLSCVLPVIFEQSSFEAVYSDCWYDKLKSGTACYGVFWNRSLDGGLGNVDIHRVDLLNLFFEPGISDIQQSKNVFHVELWDNELLGRSYPELADSLSSPEFDTARYIYDDSIDTGDKSAVIDWYYKTKRGEKTLLHYCKFCNGILLYASENDPEYRERGFYDHGKYPFVLDKLYPVQGTPCGFGIIDVMKGTQAEIDALGYAVTKHAKMASANRYFVRADGSVNEKEFADWEKPFVHYQGSGNPSSSIMPIETPALPGVYVAVLNNKIDELKETSGNRDFSQGSASGGVTAASAIAALQEAGNKNTRDMINGTYRAYEQICLFIIELIRQFYTIPRVFRICGQSGSMSFVTLCRDSLLSQRGDPPVYDIKVKAYKKSAFSRAGMNELACQLYRMGIFDADKIGQAEACLSMMEFEGKEELLFKLRENAARAAGGAAL